MSTLGQRLRKTRNLRDLRQTELEKKAAFLNS